jgi:hypothetical protein
LKISSLALVSWVLVQVLSACAGWPVVRNLCHQMADWQKGRLETSWLWIPNPYQLPSAIPTEVVVNQRRYDVLQVFPSENGLRLLVQADALESLLDVATAKTPHDFVPIGLLAGACPKPPITLSPIPKERLQMPSAYQPNWVNLSPIPPVPPPEA